MSPIISASGALVPRHQGCYRTMHQGDTVVSLRAPPCVPQRSRHAATLWWWCLPLECLLPRPPRRVLRSVVMHRTSRWYQRMVVVPTLSCHNLQPTQQPAVHLRLRVVAPQLASRRNPPAVLASVAPPLDPAVDLVQGRLHVYGPSRRMRRAARNNAVRSGVGQPAAIRFSMARSIAPSRPLLSVE